MNNFKQGLTDQILTQSWNLIDVTIVLSAGSNIQGTSFNDIERQIANTQEKNVPKDKACTNAYRAMQGQSVSKRVMKSDRALKTKDENASYYPTSLSIEIKHVHNDRWGW